MTTSESTAKKAKTNHFLVFLGSQRPSCNLAKHISELGHKCFLYLEAWLSNKTFLMFCLIYCFVQKQFQASDFALLAFTLGFLFKTLVKVEKKLQIGIYIENQLAWKKVTIWPAFVLLCTDQCSRRYDTCFGKEAILSEYIYILPLGVLTCSCYALLFPELPILFSLRLLFAEPVHTWALQEKGGNFHSVSAMTMQEC